MKKFPLFLGTFWLAATALAAGPNWLTSLPQAAAQARRDHQLVLLDFTGSDWCGWCMKLDEEVFSRREFLDYAGKNLVLVQLDYPKNKPQSKELKAANSALAKKYQVNGFPSMFIIKPDGAVLWEQRGYVEGGADIVINAANQCRKAAGLSSTPKAAATEPTAPAPAPVAGPVPAAPLPPLPPPAPKPGEEPRLKGILYSASGSTAVIDGRTCEQGDTVHGMRVLKIARDSVTVEYHGETKVLKLN